MLCDLLHQHACLIEEIETVSKTLEFYASLAQQINRKFLCRIK
jgi:hypothetical protein